MTNRPWYSGLGAVAGFVLGFVAGLAIHAAGQSAGPLVAGAAAVGTLWTNAFRAIVIPLVVTGLVVVFAGATGPHLLKRLSSLSLAVFAAMMGLASAVAVLAGPSLVEALPSTAAR